MTREMKVYLSASMTRSKATADLAEVLRRHGVDVVSTWHDLPFEESEAAAAARTDIDQLAAATVMIAFAETPGAGYQTGGRHVEFGLALALGLRIILVGAREHVFAHLTVVQVVPDTLEAVAALFQPALTFNVTPGRRQYLLGLPITGGVDAYAAAVSAGEGGSKTSS